MTRIFHETNRSVDKFSIVNESHLMTQFQIVNRLRNERGQDI